METSLTKPDVRSASGAISTAGQESTLPDRKGMAQELKAAREKTGFSREQARKLLGHHDKQFFYRWEAGKRTPDLDTAIQLCLAYRCPLAELCPSLWRYYSERVELRRVKLSEEAKNSAFRREVAHRSRKWEADIQNETTE